MEKKEKNKEKDIEEKVTEEVTTEEIEEVDISEMSKEELENEVERLKKENDKYYVHLQRTAAEFDNYKKRVSKDTLLKFLAMLA